MKVNDFNSVARTPLEEWIYYLKTGDIPATATAPGLAQARERLRLDSMSEGERRAYYSHIDDIVSLQDTIVNSRRESFESGKKEGERSAQIKMARKMKAKGTSLAEIAELTGLSEEEIERL